MIGLFANEKHAITNEIDVKKIEQIIDKIKYIKKGNRAGEKIEVYAYSGCASGGDSG